MAEQPSGTGRLLRLPEVEQITALRRSTLYHMIGLGEFPPPVKLGARASAWVESEVRAWVDERIAARRIGAEVSS